MNRKRCVNVWYEHRYRKWDYLWLGVSIRPYMGMWECLWVDKWKSEVVEKKEFSGNIKDFES